ncbi:PAAR domain-containing protein [Cupriavidus basilensis]|uniref:PAAR domain-containing protein n=1 Tax=Cupriavidus basilensis TaxID=68895 RepID=A0ABT6AMK2_9BURK|nr:PAAR domain-containing protein [Cupriavidus basilensis]MDF3833850.1 PAAR domain-containing protein [Cupriavidus basilensis]
MSNSIATVGDLHTHGGVILSGSPNRRINGRPIARRGDMVSCPLHGPNVIEQVMGLFKVDGEDGAATGDRTRCGAVLIGSAPARVSR